MRNFITPFTLRVPFTLRDGNALRVYLPFGVESNRWIHLPFKTEVPVRSINPSGFIYHLGWKCPSGFIYPSGWKNPVGSIYLLGSIYRLRWKCLSSPFTLQVSFNLQVPFTLHDGRTHWVHLPFEFHLPFKRSRSEERRVGKEC